MNIPEIPSQKKLKQIVKKLAEILHVQDWNIDIEICNAIEMSEKSDFNAQGSVTVDYRHKYASIRIGKDSVENWYKTLFHELLHILEADKFQYLKDKYDILDDTYYLSVDEQHNDLLAQILSSIYPISKILNS